MSRPRKPPARRQRSAAARLRRFWIVFVLLLCVAFVGGYYAATWPGFRPKHVAVTGNHVVSAHQIAARAGIDRRLNLWLQNMGAAAGRVATIADIGTVTIRRAFPANVSIAVTERAPYARVDFGGASIVIDHALRVLTQPGAPSLPVFMACIS